MEESRESLAKLRVVDLKQRLSALGLPVGGLKADLVERLYQYLLQESEKEQSPDVEEAPEDQQEKSPEYATKEIKNPYLSSPSSQEDLYRLQQKAMIEKHQEEQLLLLQQEALKQNEDEQKQLQALGLKPPLDESPGQPMVPHVQQPPPTLMQSPPSKNQIPQPPPESLMQHPPPMTLDQIRQQPPGPPSSAPIMHQSPPVSEPMQQHPIPEQVIPPSGPPPQPMIQMPSDQMVQRPPPEIMMQSPRPIGPPSAAPIQEDQQQIGSNQPPRRFSNEATIDRTSENKRPLPPPPPLMSLAVNAPSDEAKSVKLPQALEEALAFKQERALQLGSEESEPMEGDSENNSYQENNEMEFEKWGSDTIKQKQFAINNREEYRADSDDDPEIVPCEKKDKQKRKKKKKKKKGKAGGNEQWILKQMDEERIKKEDALKKKSKRLGLKEKPKGSDVEVQYVQEEIALDYSDPMHRYFAQIFENFKITEERVEEEMKPEEKPVTPLIANKEFKKIPKLAEDAFDDSDNEEKDDDKPKISKRKMKLLKRMSIAELKQTVSRPDVVEMHDVTAKNPKLLVHLKAARNTVSVPRHWCFKRKYLQGKRGIEKPPFELPDFIKRTGIMEMRAALQEKEDQKTLKSKMREKVRPKMGKIDIDYQKLHDAFFKWQSKPEMTIHGDLYYEGKEYETKMKDKKPGEMSDDLRIALGMPVGANAHKLPPPWLIAMQRYGPPPSYPNLKIPGLNAPIPDGCSFGYHAGGWGKPPVDSLGKPIYGDVFGTHNKDSDIPMVEEEVEKSLWGELESESEEESEEEEEEESEEEGEEIDKSGLVTPGGDTGLATPSGMSSLPAGLETPDMIEIRKTKPRESEIEGGDTPSLYTILPEMRNENVGRAMMGSSHTYDLTSAMGSRPGGGNRGVEVALDPSELDLVDTDAMAARYEATLRAQNAGDEEDFSDMVAEHAAKQRNKRRRLQQQDGNKPTKKYKDFKF